MTPIELAANLIGRYIVDSSDDADIVASSVLSIIKEMCPESPLTFSDVLVLVEESKEVGRKAMQQQQQQQPPTPAEDAVKNSNGKERFKVSDIGSIADAIRTCKSRKAEYFSLASNAENFLVAQAATDMAESLGFAEVHLQSALVKLTRASRYIQ